MAESQTVKQLTFKITTLQHQLTRKDKQLEQYQTVESEADSKIKTLNKMHADKVKNLLNSIQILKKQKASLEGQSKQHKRSKLIEQLNKQIADQDIVIEVLRKYAYNKEGREKGRQICDELIVKALTKGPDRIRPLSRQELRMEIDKLKSINLNLQGKLKNGGKDQPNNNNLKGDDDLSEISSVSEKSFVNQNEEMLKKLKDLQFDNENVKLQINAKLKIIEKLKSDLKQQDKLKIQLEVFKNQMDVANRKVSTYERLMKESKQNTNAKIIELYERQIKVEELEMVSKENRDKLSQAQEGHNIMMEEMKLEKEQLQAEIESLKSQNEQLILDNIAGKRRMDELKKIIKDMDELNGKQKDDMKSKLASAQIQIQKIVADNQKYSEGYRNIETTLFQERAQWVDEKAQLIQQLSLVRESAASKELIAKYMQQILDLKDQNSRLKQMLEAGGSGDDKILLQRLENYQRKIEFYESKGDKEAEKAYYDELFRKYNNLAEEFQEYKNKYGDKEKGKKIGRKHVIEITKKEESQYENMSSGVSKLGLEDVGSDILDNFDSSYEYEFMVNQFGERIKMPKMTHADKELLKLITSDLWDFISDDKMEKKIQQASAFYDDDSDEDNRAKIDYEKVRKIKNLTNPKGKKITLYEEQVERLNEIDDSVSITSALEKQLNQYDSDVNIQMKRMPQGTAEKKINTYRLNDVSMSVEGLSDMSSAKSGESNLMKRKKNAKVKASTLTIKKKENVDINDSDIEKSSIGSSLLDSDVSSVGIKESELAMIDSDIEPNFRKAKKK